MGDVLAAVAKTLLGLGLLGTVAANAMALWPPLAARVILSRALFTSASVSLLLGALAHLWLNQHLTGHAWPWGSSEGWSIVVLLALWGRAQTQGRARFAWLIVGLLACFVALVRLVATWG